MKFSMNGALTIALDGANIEIREEVGAENFFLFGLSAEEVSALKSKGYNPWDYYNTNAECGRSLTALHQAASRLAILTCSGRLWNRCCTEMSTFTSQITSLTLTARAGRHNLPGRCGPDVDSQRGSWANSLRSHYSGVLPEIWKAEPVKIDLEAYRQEAAGLKVKDPVLT